MDHTRNHLNRGYAFIFPSNESSFQKILGTSHKIGDREIDCKISHQGKQKANDLVNEITHKIYVKNLEDLVDTKSLRDYFSQFGKVTHAYVIYDQFTKKTKNFGFVQFIDNDIVSKVLNIKDHTIFNKRIECEKYIPRIFTKKKEYNYKAFEMFRNLAEEKKYLQKHIDDLCDEKNCNANEKVKKLSNVHDNMKTNKTEEDSNFGDDVDESRDQQNIRDDLKKTHPNCEQKRGKKPKQACEYSSERFSNVKELEDKGKRGHSHTQETELYESGRTLNDQSFVTADGDQAQYKYKEFEQNQTRPYYPNIPY